MKQKPLPPPTEFITLAETAQRWRRREITTERLLKRFGVETFRLTAKLHLYRLSDIIAIEEAAKTRPPQILRTTWTKSPKEVA